MGQGVKMARKEARDKGRPVRISNEVLGALDKKKRFKESYDAILRIILGLPTRKGKPQPLRSFWVLPTSLIAKLSKAEAKGEAVLQSVRNGKKKVMEAPIKVIETP